MSRLKALAFLLVFIVPALMPAAAWLGIATGWPDARAWSAGSWRSTRRTS
jgi:alkane 1-monooxygenase